MPKIDVKLENPKTYAALMLFFGCLFVLFGVGIESLTANPNLTRAGWGLIAVSAFLWVLEVAHHKGKR